MTTPKIYLLDWNLGMANEWHARFDDVPNVIISTESFECFMWEHSDDVDCIVSPANAYGLMDGGYDLAITRFLGEEAQQMVQKEILARFCGEQTVGTALSVFCGGYTLIHTPTMRVPSTILDDMVVYAATRSALIEAMRVGVRSMVFPALGAGTGGVPYARVAFLMRAAYDQVLNPPAHLDWDYALAQPLPDRDR